jgi:predicted metal-dependent phosphotriesterase family hydrolase
MTIQTVTGKIIPEQLGKTLMHEHFFLTMRGFKGTGRWREDREKRYWRKLLMRRPL